MVIKSAKDRPMRSTRSVFDRVISGFKGFRMCVEFVQLHSVHSGDAGQNFYSDLSLYSVD